MEEENLPPSPKTKKQTRKKQQAAKLSRKPKRQKKQTSFKKQLEDRWNNLLLEEIRLKEKCHADLIKCQESLQKNRRDHERALVDHERARRRIYTFYDGVFEDIRDAIKAKDEEIQSKRLQTAHNNVQVSHLDQKSKELVLHTINDIDQSCTQARKNEAYIRKKQEEYRRHKAARAADIKRQRAEARRQREAMKQTVNLDAQGMIMKQMEDELKATSSAKGRYTETETEGRGSS